MLLQFLRNIHTLEDIRDLEIIEIFESYEVALTIEVIDGVKCYHFKYDSVVVNWAKNPIAKECRGHIVCYDESIKDFRYLARPYDKFFNLLEGECVFEDDKIKQYSLVEKIDGSCILFWKNITGDLHVSTLGKIKNPEFEDLFLRTLKKNYNINSLEELYENYKDYLDSGHTIMFELATLENMIVSHYFQDIISLIAIRDNTTGEYRELENVFNPFRKTTSTKLVDLAINNKQDIINWAQEQSSNSTVFGLNPEGFVVYHGLVPIAKVKNTNYLHLHKFRSSIGSPKTTALVSFALGNLDDVVSVWPDPFQKIADDIYSGLQCLLEEIFVKARDITQKNYDDRKAYALEVQRVMPQFFHGLMYQNQGRDISRATIKEFILDYIIKNQNNNKKLAILESILLE